VFSAWQITGLQWQSVSYCGPRKQNSSVRLTPAFGNWMHPVGLRDVTVDDPRHFLYWDTEWSLSRSVPFPHEDTTMAIQYNRPLQYSFNMRWQNAAQHERSNINYNTNTIHKSKYRNVNQYKTLYDMRWMKLLLYCLLIFGISCVLWRLRLTWYGVWASLGSKGPVGCLGGIGFYSITLRQLRQRYRCIELA